MDHRLPSSLIHVIADDYLTDAETRRWATSCADCMQALKRYPIKQQIALRALAAVTQRTTAAVVAATDTVVPHHLTGARPLRFGLPSRVLVGHRTDDDEHGLADECLELTPDQYRELITVLPPTVRTLELEWDFDDDITCPLPSGLRSLRFRNDLGMAISGQFNRSVTHWQLPSSLTELQFPAEFNQPIDDLHLPSQLRILILGRGYKHSIRLLRLPDGLRTFSGGGTPDLPQPLPSSLVRLRLGNAIVDSTALEMLDWPSSLTELGWGWCSKFNASLQGVHLPNSVRSLCLPYLYNLSLEDFTFPTSLTRLGYAGRVTRI